MSSGIVKTPLRHECFNGAEGRKMSELVDCSQFGRSIRQFFLSFWSFSCPELFWTNGSDI